MSTNLIESLQREIAAHWREEEKSVEDCRSLLKDNYGIFY